MRGAELLFTERRWPRGGLGRHGGCALGRDLTSPQDLGAVVTDSDRECLEIRILALS